MLDGNGKLLLAVASSHYLKDHTQGSPSPGPDPAVSAGSYTLQAMNLWAPMLPEARAVLLFRGQLL